MDEFIGNLWKKFTLIHCKSDVNSLADSIPNLLNDSFETYDLYTSLFVLGPVLTYHSNLYESKTRRPASTGIFFA